MKLLFCEECWDVFKLARELRTCACGKVSGKYLYDGHNSVNNGQGISMALNNNMVYSAIATMKKMQESHESYDDYYTDATIPFWVRPNEGRGNPRSQVRDVIEDE